MGTRRLGSVFPNERMGLASLPGVWPGFEVRFSYDDGTVAYCSYSIQSIFIFLRNQLRSGTKNKVLHL